jgi:hypothetical protein
MSAMPPATSNHLLTVSAAIASLGAFARVASAADEAQLGPYIGASYTGDFRCFMPSARRAAPPDESYARTLE